MTMPKAAVNENRQPVLWKNKVRRSRKVFSMHPKAKPQSMSYAPNLHFRSGILVSDAGHVRAALRWAKTIHAFNPSKLLALSQAVALAILG
jgi:hypothetical protein